MKMNRLERELGRKKRKNKGKVGCLNFLNVCTALGSIPRTFCFWKEDFSV